MNRLISIFLKVVAGLVLTILLVVASGVLGLTFIAWPTFIADQAIVVTPRMLEDLARLKQEPKFVADPSHFYFGATSAKSQDECQAAVNAAIDTIIRELPSTPRSSLILGIFKQSLASFPSSESEERDQFLMYLQRIMAIAGVPSSHELFNVWRYGFPYGWLIR